MKLNSFNTFNDVEPKRLKAFNRVAVSFNILEDFGKSHMEEYLKQFSKQEQLEIMVMGNYIKKVGVKQARLVVTEGLPLDDE